MTSLTFDNENFRPTEPTSSNRLASDNQHSQATALQTYSLIAYRNSTRPKSMHTACGRHFALAFTGFTTSNTAKIGP